MKDALPEPETLAAAVPAERNFSVLSQRVELDVSFQHRSLQGSTELLILPGSKELKQIHLNCRQCDIQRVTVEGKAALYEYEDIYQRLTPHKSFGIHQHHILRDRLQPHLRQRPEEELAIYLPPGIVVQDLDPDSIVAQDFLIGRSTKAAGDMSATLDTPNVTSLLDPGANLFVPLKIKIDFSTHRLRDGLHFVGWDDGDGRYPHVYTRNSLDSGSACCLFPCLDDPLSRHPWEICIRCPRTLGDAFSGVPSPAKTTEHQYSNTQSPQIQAQTDSPAAPGWRQYGLTEVEAALDLSVICSGDMTDEIIDQNDGSRKTCSFTCNLAVSASQIGFAIGPFDDIDLSDLREVDDDEKLGSSAIRVHAYSLPQRSDEVRNTCMPIAKAIDFFTTAITTYPFESYKMCFVDDQVFDTIPTAGLCLCSTRLLFPDDILDPLDDVTRKLIQALSTQYSGITMTAKEPADAWIIVGIASFLTDIFLKQLMGNNEYRFHQKLVSDKVLALDFERPSLRALGSILQLDKLELDFLALKAGAVLYILDRRLTKSGSTSGITRIISRLVTNAKTGDAAGTLLSSSHFQRLCEKMGHLKLESFFQQWVEGAGCPHFQVTQRFNKKKLVVDMLIRQVQSNEELRAPRDKDLQPGSFMRDVREDAYEVYAGAIQTAFTGPMTIRIHEADGTPYEHIVEIKEAVTKFEIPYNTKYKRLKRSRRQKERAAAAAGTEPTNDTQDDVLLYCLGDVLQSQEEVADWRLTDWTKEEEEKMGLESYEWIRMDADFEWICEMKVGMPHYMFVSQLQQDRDVVAQLESIQYITSQKGHPIISTILTRTLLDRRYFHGIRTAAAAGLAKCARDELDWIGSFHLEKAFQEMFCLSDGPMTRPNDFSDRTSYLVQCQIPRIIAEIKDNAGQAPLAVKKFFIEKLKFNDNTDNEFSDCYYVSTLMSSLANSLRGPSAGRVKNYIDNEDGDEYELRRNAITEITRYRRIDEWISSYHNVYTVTALGCLAGLAQDNVIPVKMTDFLQYSRAGNAEAVRLKAFACLVDLNALKTDGILAYFLHTLSTDPSPYVRQEMIRLLGIGLGQLAIGNKQDGESTEDDSFAVLVVEQEGSIEARQADLARRRTVEGALAALKTEFAGREAFKKALWSAVSSSMLSLDELSFLLDLCATLYDPVDALTVVLQYPRYWTVRHIGRGVMKFSNSSRVRMKPMPALPRPTPLPPLSLNLGPNQARLSQPGPIKRKLSSSTNANTYRAAPPRANGASLVTPAMPVPPAIITGIPSGRTILKLKTTKFPPSAFNSTKVSTNAPSSNKGLASFEFPSATRGSTFGPITQSQEIILGSPASGATTDKTGRNGATSRQPGTPSDETPKLKIRLGGAGLPGPSGNSGRGSARSPDA